MTNNELTNRKYCNLRDEFWNNLFSPLSNNTVGNMMMTDIKEEENSYLLAIDVPGIKKEEVKIDLKDGYLNVEVNHNEEKENDDNKYIRHERFFGSYSRSFYVGDVDKEKIEATIDNGVLNIVLPKENPEEKDSYITIK